MADVRDPTANPKVATYARQSVGEEQGISQQLQDTRDEARRRGWPILVEFVDNDTSASKARGASTDWAAMLRAYDAGQFDTLLVTETSRLTRTLSDVLDITPPRRNMRVVVIRESVDTAIDDFLLKQLVLLAEREVKLKSQRAERYARERRKAGHPAPGRPPHGYRWVPAIERDDAGTRYVIVEDEAADVRRIFSEFLADAPLGQIARDLTTAGRKTRAGTRWHSSSVRRVLLNPVYAGLLPPAQPTGKHDLSAIDLEACANGAWQAIVQRDEVRAARSRLVGVRPNHSGNARQWLLSGLAICSVCRTPVRSARGETHPTAKKDGSGTAKSKRYQAYRCVNGHFMRNGAIIDEYVAEACIGRLTRDALDLVAPKDDAPDIPALNARRLSLEAKARDIALLIARDKLSPALAEPALDEIAAERESVNVVLAEALRKDPLAEMATVDDVRAWWSEATLARRRTVIDLMMAVVIHPVGHGRRVMTLDQAAASVTVEWRR